MVSRWWYIPQSNFSIWGLVAGGKNHEQIPIQAQYRIKCNKNNFIAIKDPWNIPSWPRTEFTIITLHGAVPETNKQSLCSYQALANHNTISYLELQISFLKTMPANVSKMDKKVVRSLRLAWKIKDFATRQITGQILILIHTPAHSIIYYCLLHPYNSHNIPPPPTYSFKLIKVDFKLPHHRWLAAKSFLDIFNSLFPLSPAQPFHPFPSILQAIVYSLKKRNTHKMLWEDPFSYWFSHSLTIEQLNH